jgi:hypothetical protein
MLVRKISSSVFSIPGLIVAGLLSGCIITSGSTGSGSGSGSGSGDGGGFGSGGDTTTASSSQASSGAGGGELCVSSMGEGSAADCELLNIAPSQGAPEACFLDKLPPYGYEICVHAYDVYTTGAADDLQLCLAEIGVEDACTDPPVAVNDCVAAMYQHACDDPAIADNCESLAGTCATNETFDSIKCNEELRPLNNSALQQLLNCFDAASQVACQKAYDDCYDQLVQVQ